MRDAFHYADLEGTNLQGDTATGANLVDATLNGSNLHGLKQ